ncbi:NrfD/PsrC family molybdoenzyme membrane anchor subunit [Solemya elarraichensis gill symbiont]|uniref:Molybdopterin oxidoreductase n=1 Tax=Solemya elarraichensis gill symbiont TaxID=1918949 RepID=A0A1T2LD75_9GAMM|nr:NrfD/PsrC family molybdoenzyme membrane anchor subunit [Solemya elarraichensis gill symbiont]OOZ43039.1 molybdopterin oxidoreductase [Solemya elarraichensis gill symbiont]
MKKIFYKEWDIASQTYWMILAVLAVISAVAGFAVLHMEHSGHWVTGMSNQIVWGTPHVFAVFLIVAASGALNVASIASVFNKKAYKPLAPLSALLAVALLIGGLLILVLDLGRPERLMVAMTTYNFKSIFAWNILLYNGFIAIVAFYLWTILDRKMNRFYKAAGVAAFVWRLILTTGTGSIFGFLVARQGYDAAILAPWFIIMSFGFGLAIYMLVLSDFFRLSDRPLGDSVMFRLKNLLGVFVAASLLLTLMYHMTNLYGTENHAFEAFILRDGGIYTALFWIGEILIGGLLPLAIVFHPSLGKSRSWIYAAAIMVIIGGIATIYVIIIGGQAFPMAMFPGKTVIASGFYDGINGLASTYSPSLAEALLGIGGGVRMLKILPMSMADEVADPHSAS